MTTPPASRTGTVDAVPPAPPAAHASPAASAGQPQAPSAEDFQRMQASPEFQDLRRRLRRFVFPMTVFFIGWYLLYVLLGIYATGFMGTPVLGNINIGILLGLGQFVTTFGITAWYIVFANRELDPRAAAIRDEMEGAGA